MEPRLRRNQTQGLICQQSTTPLSCSIFCRDENMNLWGQLLQHIDFSVSDWTPTVCLLSQAAYKHLCSCLEQVSLYTQQKQQQQNKVWTTKVPMQLLHVLQLLQVLQPLQPQYLLSVVQLLQQTFFSVYVLLSPSNAANVLWQAYFIVFVHNIKYQRFSFLTSHSVYNYVQTVRTRNFLHIALWVFFGWFHVSPRTDSLVCKPSECLVVVVLVVISPSGSAFIGR